MRVVDRHLGHELAARAEQAKIDVAGGGDTTIELAHVERGLQVALSEGAAGNALMPDLARIVAAARETTRLAGVAPGRVDTLYFTGGSTGLRLLAEQIAAAFPSARPLRGDRFASVATGLGLYAQRCFGGGGRRA
jgi:hypothetical chaperone protein